jgi:protein-S-isoprenylcysteine O-methyltransferase Ste14
VRRGRGADGRGDRFAAQGDPGRARHPIYTGIATLIAGLFLRAPTLALAFCAVVVVAFLFAKTQFEERLLAARYPEYAEYRRRTWGLVPGIR